MNSFLKIFSWILLVFIPAFASASIDPTKNVTDKTKALYNYGAFGVKDDKFGNAAFDFSKFQVVSKQAFVTLRVGDIPASLLSAGGNNTLVFEVDIKIKPYTDQQNPSVQGTPVNTTLTVTYNKAGGTQYKGLDSYELAGGAFQMDIEILDVRCAQLAGVAKADIKGLQLEADLIINRKYITPSYGSPNVGTYTVITSFVPAKKQLTVACQSLGAEDYDIEMTTVDNGSDFMSVVNNMINAPANVYDFQLDPIFKNNATRVSAKPSGKDYTFSLILDNDYVLIRTRTVNYDQSGNRVTGDWVYKCRKEGVAAETYAVFANTWNDPAKNWQYSATFAENGKSKESINYYDGTLRNRQTVALVRTDGASAPVVQEDIYDEFGRKAVSVLPAPVADGENPYLHYFENFNLNSSSKAYSITNVLGASGDCEVLPQAMVNSSGAARYYSTNNQFKTNELKFNNSIPDALGYPFAVTQYTKDNTGRIKLQGGVGQVFQPGYPGGSVNSNTTKYYYGKPEQWELDRLFGNDVGYAEHYTKNMVMDPNGQISISYQNASGKTIATALTGTKPASLDALSTYNNNLSKTSTRILNPSQFTFSGNDLKITATSTYLASLPDNAVTLEVNIAQLKETYPGNGLCSNCYYKLKMRITDDCGNEIYSNITNTEIGSKDPNCSYTDAAPIKTFPNINFPKIGEYTITIDFLLDKEVIENYTDGFLISALSTNNLQKRYAFIKQRYLTGIDLSGCYKDCTTCQLFEKQGKPAFLAQARARFEGAGIDVTSAGADKTDFELWAGNLYETIKIQCNLLRASCTVSPCSDLEALMKADISPGGQYAQFKDGAPQEAAINVIYSKFSSVFGAGVTPPAVLTEDDYVTLPNSERISVYNSKFTLGILLDNWNPSWADKFLPYHPEFCKLQFCQNSTASKNWDEKVRNIVTRTDSIKYLNNNVNLSYSDTTPLLLLNLDPFFLSGPGAIYRDSISADLQNYTRRVLKIESIDGQVQFPSISLSKYARALLSCKTTVNGQDRIDWVNCTPICIAPQKEWNIYKDLYLQLKELYYQKAMLAGCGTSGCAIGTASSGTLASFTNTCSTPSEFIIESYNNDPSNPPCDSLSQRIKVVYTGTRINGNTAVKLAYPDGIVSYQKYVNGTLTSVPVQTLVPMIAGQRFAYVCVPKELNTALIKIQSVQCINMPSAIPGQKYIEITEVETSRNDFQLYQWDGFWNGGHNYYDVHDIYHEIRIQLKDANGNNTTSSEPVSITLKYNRNFPDPPNKVYRNQVQWTAFNKTITIPANDPNGFAKDNFHYSYPYRTDYPNARIQTDYQLYLANPVIPSNYKLFNEITNGLPPTPPSNPNCSPLYADKIPRFPMLPSNGLTAEVITNDNVTAINSQNTQTIGAVVSTNCELIADQLIAALGTTVPANKLAELRSKLIDVCQAGGDAAHLMGVSALSYNASPSYNSVPKSLSASGHSSFGSVLKQVLLNNAAQYTAAVNPWVTGTPYTYDVPQQAAGKVISSTDADICARLTTLRNAYTATLTGGATYSDAGFHVYLASRFGAAMTLSQSQLSELVSSCANCNELVSEPLQLPVFMDPANPGFITKSQYNAALSDLASQFGGNLPETASNYETVFTNFMNLKFGFGLSQNDYKQFGDNPSTTAILVNRLQFRTVDADPFACAMSLIESNLVKGLAEYNQYILDARDLFRSKYIATCSAAQAYVNINTRAAQYQYTLYYYDQADNLVRTIPPEGVRVITEENQLTKIQANRAGPDFSSCLTTYNGPVINHTPAQIFSALETNFNNGQGGTIELWLYTADGTPARVVQKTPNGQYQFQLTQSGSILSVEILSTPYNGSFQKNNRVILDIGGVANLQNWNHITIYSSNFVTVPPQVLVNGVMPPRAGFQGTWSVAAQDLSSLKFLRLYNARKLPVNELQVNAISTCFTALYSDHTWFRYNLPSTGGETTVGTGTVEVNNSFIYPEHKLATNYYYNSANQVVKQNSPDGGTNQYWYDMLSRLVFSQNDKQKKDDLYSYTVYEPTLGRIVEVGQKHYVGDLLTKGDYLEETNRNTVAAINENTEITNTVYDRIQTGINGVKSDLVQTNIRKRVATSYYRESQNDAATQATYYAYDVTGNVKTLWQQIDGLGNPKRLDYEFDLISGKVNFLRYQDGQPDQFYYAYTYDAENRITEAWSGTKATIDEWSGSMLYRNNKKRDARYYYYLHGPLARTVLGDELTPVQGIDYAYTLQGWLKGVNSTNLAAGTDPSNDGGTGALNGSSIKTKDAYGFALHYFGDSDYKPVGSTNPFANAAAVSGFRPLYNGNIAASAINIAFPSPTSNQVPQLYKYDYDQLNRLKRQSTFRGLNASTNVWSFAATGAYGEQVDYDANGNIKTYSRYDNANQIDNLTYNYKRDASNSLLNNRLTSIRDQVSSTVSSVDIDNQADNYYNYDEIGNIIGEGNIKYEWNVYGKLKKVVNSPDVLYAYNTNQQRTSKKLGSTLTFYVRDAQGNTIAVYDKPGATVNWKEQYLFGSDRLGSWDASINNVDNASGQGAPRWLNMGFKQYELKNHLGNVLVTLSDRQVKDATGTTDVLTSDVKTAQDYYPFGMGQPGRQSFGTAYRYGFNGKENDNDVGKGSGNQQDYGMRIYDPRVGRFLSVDPLTSSYPWNSSYAFAENRVISGIDLDGSEYVDVNGNPAGPLNEQYARKTAATLMPGFSAKPKLELPKVIKLSVTSPPIPTIAMADMYGNGHIGPAPTVIANVVAIRQEYKNAVGDNIRGGLAGTIGYYIGGDRGSFAGAIVDGVMMSTSNLKGPAFFGPKIATLEVDVIDAGNIRFSQRTVNGIHDLVGSMRSKGWSGSPIDVVELEGGKFGALDNTRVLAAHEAGISVEAVIHKRTDILTPNEVLRFSTEKGSPKTWGDAYNLRIGNQGATFKKNNPNGSYTTHGKN